MLQQQNSKPWEAVAPSGSIDQIISSIPGLDQAATKWSAALHNAVLNGGDVVRGVTDALQGTWLGHPLHPVLIHIPLGAWMLAGMFDAYGAISGSRHAMQTADRLITIGIVAAVPTALAGMADYSAIPKDAASVGAAHALLNSAGLGLYIASLWSRTKGARSRGVVLAALALSTVGASASLGGDLVYRKRVGVNHTPQADLGNDWIYVPDYNANAGPGRQPVSVDGIPVLVYRQGDTISAISAVCSHAGGPLQEGEIQDNCVTCPWHHSVFSLHDGSVVHGPATQAQPTYETRLREGRLELRCRPA